MKKPTSDGEAYFGLDGLIFEETSVIRSITGVVIEGMIGLVIPSVVSAASLDLEKHMAFILVEFRSFSSRENP